MFYSLGIMPFGVVAVFAMCLLPMCHVFATTELETSRNSRQTSKAPVFRIEKDRINEYWTRPFQMLRMHSAKSQDALSVKTVPDLGDEDGEDMDAFQFRRAHRKRFGLRNAHINGKDSSHRFKSYLPFTINANGLFSKSMFAVRKEGQKDKGVQNEFNSKYTGPMDEDVLELSMEQKYASEQPNDQLTRSPSQLDQEGSGSLSKPISYDHQLETEEYQTDSDSDSDTGTEFYKREKRQSRSGDKQSTFPFKCAGNCGVDMYLPCSCAPSCVVYDNCCEEFQEHCPDTFQEGQRRYADFLEAEVICSTNNLLVITSCRETNQSQHNASDTPAPKSLVEFIKAQAPIFDTYTKLVFINETIYKCNQYPQSQGKLWGIAKFDIKDSTEIQRLQQGNLTFESLQEILTTEKASYSFSPDKNQDYGLNNCFTDVKRTCSMGLLGNSKFDEYKEKCESLTSYIKCNDKLYANFYCMKCTNLFNEAVICKNVNDIDAKRSGPTSVLSLLVSFNNNEMVVESANTGKQTDSWNSISCDIDKGDSCNVVTCPEKSKLDGNNSCSRDVYVSFKIRVKSRIPSRIVASLTTFLACKLNALADVEAISHQEASNKADGNMHEIHTSLRIVGGKFSDEVSLEDILSDTMDLKEALAMYVHFAGGLSQDDLFEEDYIRTCTCSSFEVCDPLCSRDELVFAIERKYVEALAYNYDDLGGCLTVIEDLVNGSSTRRPAKEFWLMTCLAFAVALVTSRLT